MNWKQLAKTVVDEVKAWANERFADLAKVRELVAAEVRELVDAQRAAVAEQRKLEAKLAELAGRPAPLATVDGAVVTNAVATWFEKNPPPIPKDGTSVKVDDLEPYLQAGLAKWQLEFERNASGVLQRFLDKLRQPADGTPGKDATPEGIARAVAEFMAEHPLPELDAAAMEAGVLELASATVAKWLAENPPKGEPGPAPSPEAVAAAVAAHLEKHPPPAGKDGEPGPGATVADVGDAVARYLEAHPIRVPVDGKNATAEGVRAAVDSFMAEHPLPQLDVAVVTAACLEEVRHAAADWLKKNPPPGPAVDAIRAAVDAYCKENPPPARGPTPDELAPLVSAWLEAHPLPIPKDGANATDGQVAAAVARHIELHPIRTGKDADPEQIAAAVAAWLGSHPVKDGEPGRDVTPEQVAEAVANHLEAHPIPTPKDGTSVTLEDVAPLFAKAFAEWALDFERRAADTFARAIDRIEKPKDGRDGLNVENFEAELEEGTRNMRLVLADGERRHTATVKLVGMPLDRGVFKDNEGYERGDGVTFGGSFWLAQKDNPKGRPGQTSDWRLAVKHGRDAPKK